MAVYQTQTNQTNQNFYSTSQTSGNSPKETLKANLTLLVSELKEKTDRNNKEVKEFLLVVESSLDRSSEHQSALLTTYTELLDDKNFIPKFNTEHRESLKKAILLFVSAQGEKQATQEAKTAQNDSRAVAQAPARPTTIQTPAPAVAAIPQPKPAAAIKPTPPVVVVARPVVATNGWLDFALSQMRTQIDRLSSDKANNALVGLWEFITEQMAEKNDNLSQVHAMAAYAYEKFNKDSIIAQGSSGLMVLLKHIVDKTNGTAAANLSSEFINSFNSRMDVLKTPQTIIAQPRPVPAAKPAMVKQNQTEELKLPDAKPCTNKPKDEVDTLLLKTTGACPPDAPKIDPTTTNEYKNTLRQANGVLSKPTEENRKKLDKEVTHLESFIETLPPLEEENADTGLLISNKKEKPKTAATRTKTSWGDPNDVGSAGPEVRVNRRTSLAALAEGAEDPLTGINSNTGKPKTTPPTHRGRSTKTKK